MSLRIPLAERRQAAVAVQKFGRKPLFRHEADGACAAVAGLRLNEALINDRSSSGRARTVFGIAGEIALTFLYRPPYIPRLRAIGKTHRLCKNAASCREPRGPG